MVDYKGSLLKRIYKARALAACFFNSLKSENGWKYTSTHDVNRYPAALLFGSWSAILGLTLLNETQKWNKDEKKWAIDQIYRHQRKGKEFLGEGLEKKRNSKSIEYLKLHCTNYSIGAIYELEDYFDIQIPYLERFLDGNYLAYWLEARSLLRPWEEGNNIVNVASHLALCNDYGIPKAQARLEQLLEWHKKHQNPKTGGFDCFSSPNSKQRLETLAGAVHNFHLYHYLNEPIGCEALIADSLPNYLFRDNLTACLSIDFIELAVLTLPYSSDPDKLLLAIIYQTEALLSSQREDGGWLEAGNDQTPTSAAGFKDNTASSCSYATWFRLAALGLVAISLLGDDAANWMFRRTLGMGYNSTSSPSYDLRIEPITYIDNLKIKVAGFPQGIKSKVIRLGSKFI